MVWQLETVLRVAESERLPPVPGFCPHIVGVLEPSCSCGTHPPYERTELGTSGATCRAQAHDGTSSTSKRHGAASPRQGQRHPGEAQQPRRGISQAAVRSSNNKKFVHQGLEARHASVVDELVKHKEPEDFQSRYGDDEPRKGSDVLVEALEREVRPTQELCVCS